MDGPEPNRNSRGRPAAFSEDTLRRAAGFSYAREVGSRRGAQDLVYRMFAIAVLEHFLEAFPEKAKPLSWLLTPRRRHALLTELGRIAQPRSDSGGGLQWNEVDVSRLVDAAFQLAEVRPSTKAGVAMMRNLRRSPPGTAPQAEPVAHVDPSTRNDQGRVILR